MTSRIDLSDVVLRPEGKYAYWVVLPHNDTIAMVLFNTATKRWDWEYDNGGSARIGRNYNGRDAAVKSMLRWMGYTVTGQEVTE